MGTVTFIVSEELKSTLQAAGAAAPIGSIESCPLHVGDVIAYPGPIAMAVRVVERVYFPADEQQPGRWFVRVEQTPTPT